jgi:hypothetical protein
MLSKENIKEKLKEISWFKKNSNFLFFLKLFKII